VDDNSLCTGECHGDCIGGECEDLDIECNWCQDCVDGDCELAPGNECDENEDCDPTCEYCDTSEGGSCECECNLSITNVTANKNPACINEEVTFTATIDPDNSQYYDCINWNIGGTGKIVTKSWEDPDTYTVTASACSGDTSQNYQIDIEAPTSVGLAPISVLNLDPGLICRNAQDDYKKAKWQVTIEGCGTANVEDDGGYVTVTFEGYNGSNPSALINGDYFYVNAPGSNVGDYKIKLTSNNDASLTSTGESYVFKFISGLATDRPQTNPSPDDGEGTFGGTVTPPDPPGAPTSGEASGTYSLSFMDDIYHPFFGDYPVLDWTGGGSLKARTDFEGSDWKGYTFQANMSQSEGQYCIAAIPAVYTGNVKTRYVVEYGASTHYQGFGTSSYEGSLSYSYAILSATIATLEITGHVATQTAIAVRVEDSTQVHDSDGVSIDDCGSGPKEDDYTLSISFTTEDFVREVPAALDVWCEAAVQSVRHNNYGIRWITNTTSIDDLSMELTEDGYQIVE